MISYRLCLYFILLATAILPYPSFAQRRDKMSSFVRITALTGNAAGHERIMLKSPGDGLQSKRAEMCAFVRIRKDGEKILQAHDSRILARFGTIYIASIPLDQLDNLSNEPEVNRIEASRSCFTLMDSVIAGIRAGCVYSGTGLPQAYTGAGVIVGLVDVGFDLTHPNFFNSSMSSYRVVRMWDQLAPSDGKMYIGADFIGKEDLLSKGSSTDGAVQTHGTETAGIAAGSGYDTPYRGVSNESDLCLVSNYVSNDWQYVDTKDIYKYTDATNALAFKYIFDYAKSVGKPCVISFSEGSYAGFSNDEQLYYEVLDSLCGPGRILVVSAGNLAGYTNYVHKTAEKDSSEVYLYKPDSICMATLKSSDRFSLTLEYGTASSAKTMLFDSHDILLTKDSMINKSDSLDGHKYSAMVNAYESAIDKSIVYDLYLKCDDGIGTSFPVKLKLAGKNTDVELFRRTCYFYRTPTGGIPDGGDNSRCIMSPAASSAVISVGATERRESFTNYKGEKHTMTGFRYGMRSYYSSVGPTFDGRIKPDISAPGTNVISSESSYYEEGSPEAKPLESDVSRFTYNGRIYGWNCDTGTSMSAPVCAGTIALWLQADPHLTRDDILEIFSLTARRPDESLTYPNNYYGYGEIDAYRGILEVLRRRTGLHAIISRDVAKAQLHYAAGRIVLDFPHMVKYCSIKIYDLSGMLRLSGSIVDSGETEAGMDVSSLPEGVYVVNIAGPEDVKGSLIFRKN